MRPARSALTHQQMVDLFELEPMPLEGGMFRQTWCGPATGGRPAGTTIIALLAPHKAHFSAMHRLPTDETWHFLLGDPVELLLLAPDGSWQVELFGNDIAAGEKIQLVVPAGVWMGGRVAEGGAWSLFSCTVAPGFISSDYEGGDVEELCQDFPGAADRIRALCRPGAPLRHPRGP